MTVNDETETRIRNKFKVVSVEKTKPPAGMDGGTWYHYEIKCAGSSLYGTRSGTLEQVTEHAEAFAEELNFRDQNKGKKRMQNHKKQSS